MPSGMNIYCSTCRQTRHFQSEPALPGASRTGDRDEPDVRAREQGHGLGQVRAPPDEPMVQGGQGGPTQGANRREAVGQARRGQLKELLRSRDVLEPMASEGAK